MKRIALVSAAAAVAAFLAGTSLRSTSAPRLPAVPQVCPEPTTTTTAPVPAAVVRGVRWGAAVPRASVGRGVSWGGTLNVTQSQTQAQDAPTSTTVPAPAVPEDRDLVEVNVPKVNIHVHPIINVH